MQMEPGRLKKVKGEKAHVYTVQHAHVKVVKVFI